MEEKMKTLMKHLFYLSALLVLAVSTAYADIDPATAQKLLAGDGADNDQFSRSVSLSGDTAVIGAAYDDDKGDDSGSAYVFVRAADGMWHQQAKLTASDGTAGDRFGNAVAVSGDTLVVGAYLDDHQDAYAGSAYIFTRSDSVWTQQKKLEVTDRRSLFGCSVSLDGDTLAIGARHDSQTGLYAGAAHIFTRVNGDWTQQKKLTANEADDGYTGGSQLGYSVSVDGDTVVIGALDDDNQDAGWSDSGPGSAYVFTRSGNVWNRQGKLVDKDGKDGDMFGRSVSVDGDTIMIGAFAHDSNDMTHSGAAYVYTRAADCTVVADADYTCWNLQQKLTADDGMVGDLFGNSVALDGNVALIGAQKTDGYDGAAYVFGRSGTSWTQYRKLTALDDGLPNYLGWAVALSGDAAFVAANKDDETGSGAIGSAWAFSLVRLALQDALAAVNALDPAVFKKNKQTSLSNQINAALALVEQNLNADALVQAQSILGKTDGCATSGTPDNNDWITDCASQEQVRPFIQEAIVYLNNMMR
jgi:hypothetical protein